MILQPAELTPSQKAAIEETAGRKLQDTENIVVCGGTPKVASFVERQNSVLQMRYQLDLLDRSQRRMSIEDCMAAMLEQSGTELPA
ncbi:MAG TPA: hypothetical protein VK764_03000 [Terracidiphilus sp.]|jgi:hypothetical protein|nr:hypothetical protein [Terracidiphilus sp.]